MLPRESNVGRGGARLKPKRAGPIGDYLDWAFRHFNAGTLKDAADAYVDLIDGGGQMFLAMAGAMSTAEIGLSLAEMIRHGKVSAISCTGANLEESLFDLVAHDAYVRIPDYRDKTPKDDQRLMDTHLPRVTDTAIPEQQAMGVIEDLVIEQWKDADHAGTPKFPHEFLYAILETGVLQKKAQIDPRDCWMVAAQEKNLPIVVPGWEDSTLGNVFAALCRKGELKTSAVKGGIDYMLSLADWYTRHATSTKGKVGFFQIGGGIAGDFSICVVPMLRQDQGQEELPLWAYFCQITDAVESYGGYSGAGASEKISWGKVDAKTPRFMIQSDATICAPLIFARVLGW